MSERGDRVAVLFWIDRDMAIRKLNVPYPLDDKREEFLELYQDYILKNFQTHYCPKKSLSDIKVMTDVEIIRRQVHSPKNAALVITYNL